MRVPFFFRKAARGAVNLSPIDVVLPILTFWSSFLWANLPMTIGVFPMMGGLQMLILAYAALAETSSTVLAVIVTVGMLIGGFLLSAVVSFGGAALSLLLMMRVRRVVWKALIWLGFLVLTFAVGALLFWLVVGLIILIG